MKLCGNVGEEATGGRREGRLDRGPSGLSDASTGDRAGVLPMSGLCDAGKHLLITLSGPERPEARAGALREVPAPTGQSSSVRA